MSILCCNDNDRTLCGQTTTVAKCAMRCTLCLQIGAMRPLPCPLGGPCTKVGTSTTTEQTTDTRIPLASVGMRVGWVNDEHGEDVPSIEGLSDEELLNFVYQRYADFRRHQQGEHNCPCWRCTMLRRVGFFPAASFSTSPSSQSLYVRTIRDGHR